MSLAINDESKCWLIFDSCTRPSYYQDLHNLLAAPVGHVLRYEYKLKYLTSEVTAILSTPGTRLPRRILFAYVQDRQYTRGSNPVFTLAAFNDGLWLATRFGDLLNVVHEGDRYFFDFALSTYPDNKDAVEMFKGAFDQGLAPPVAWVAIMPKERLAALTNGSDDENFAHIAQTLAVTPSQFAGDVFWRAVRLSRAGEASGVHILREEDVYGRQVRQVRSAATLNEAGDYLLEISTLRSPSGRTQAAPTNFRIEVASDNKEHVRVVGSGTFDVRQYTALIVELATAPIVSLRDSVLTELTLLTVPLDGDWPQGPRLAMRLRVSRHWARVTLGLMALALGVVTAAPAAWGIGTDAFTPLRASGLLAGSALVVLGASLWTGKLTTR